MIKWSLLPASYCPPQKTIPRNPKRIKVPLHGCFDSCKMGWKTETSSRWKMESLKSVINSLPETWQLQKTTVQVIHRYRYRSGTLISDQHEDVCRMSGRNSHILSGVDGSGHVTWVPERTVDLEEWDSRPWSSYYCTQLSDGSTQPPDGSTK